MFFNSTHSGCECSKGGSFNLLEELVKKNLMAKTRFLVIVSVTLAVSTIVSSLWPCIATESR